MSQKVLTIEEIQEARKLKERFKYTKRQLAKLFDVGGTTIWENINAVKRTRPGRREYFQIYWKKEKQVITCIPCSKCSICLTKEFDDQRIPVNYQIGSTCIECYLRGVGLTYVDLLEV